MLPSLFAKGNKRSMEKLKKLRKEAQKDKEPRVVLRIQGIMLSLEKHSVNDIADLLHVHRSTVNLWVTAWNDFGESGLLEGYRCGRPSKLTDQQKEKLWNIVDSGPVAYGLRSGVWTSPIIRQIIEEEFSIDYHTRHVPKLLKKMGFSVQRPTTKLVQADQKQQNKWIRYDYPNLKKTPVKKKR